MAIGKRRKPGRARRPEAIHKPRGAIHPRVQKVGPEHFGVVSVDCAKARSKWMLADFYGNVLVAPTTVEHNRVELELAVTAARDALARHELRDALVAVERTGRYHHPIKPLARRASRCASYIPSPPSNSGNRPIPETDR